MDINFVNQQAAKEIQYTLDNLRTQLPYIKEFGILVHSSHLFIPNILDSETLESIVSIKNGDHTIFPVDIIDVGMIYACEIRQAESIVASLKEAKDFIKRYS